MRRADRQARLLTVMGSIVLAGCTTMSPVTSRVGPDDGVASPRTALVLPPAMVTGARADADPGPEYGRNDHLLGRDPAGIPPAQASSEIEIRERLWISNGRPREHTAQRSRSVTIRNNR
jgi:hypothetical protein